MALSVALRKESVDRNDKISTILITRETVALRKESVDRNIARCQLPTPEPVALRKESVDRNCRYPACCVVLLSSLSARRAWIEIVKIMSASSGSKPSLSARRAWIEIRLGDMSDAWNRVALRKESVDRNRQHD